MSTDHGAVYDFEATRLDGTQAGLGEYAKNVLLVVNTASQCGFTPQYAGLERLYQTYKDRGFSVLGFPCNQFGGQEPGSAGEIGAFCQKNYGVSFPMFAKIEVNGPNTHPLYAYLKHVRPGIFGTGKIKWNFTKFLIDRQGRAVARFAPSKKPEALAGEIERLLNESSSNL